MKTLNYTGIVYKTSDGYSIAIDGIGGGYSPTLEAMEISVNEAIGLYFGDDIDQFISAKEPQAFDDVMKDPELIDGTEIGCVKSVVSADNGKISIETKFSKL